MKKILFIMLVIFTLFCCEMKYENNSDTLTFDDNKSSMLESFYFDDITNGLVSDAVGEINGNQILVTVPGVTATLLTPTIITTGESVEIQDVNPDGTVDITKTIIFTITGKDDKIETYYVYVNEAPEDSNEIFSVRFVVGGTTAVGGEFPFMAAIRYLDFDSRICAGTLISDQWVVTAAHCMYHDTNRTKLKAHRLNVILGRNKLNSQSGEVHKVESIYTHPNFSIYSGLTNDIALLKLATRSKYAPAKMATVDENAGVLATVAGWGALSEGGSGTPILRKVSLPIVTNETCNRRYGNIASSHICAGYSSGEKSACQGDSGGPLFIRKGNGFTQLGIVSRGKGCARPGYYGIYTRVRSYRSWINSIVGSNTGDDNGNQKELTPKRLSASDISVADQKWIHYNAIKAQQGKFKVVISGSKGDVDLYVRKGAQPTSSLYDCRPYKDGSNEECVLNGPGDFYISLFGYKEASDLNIQVDYYDYK